MARPNAAFERMGSRLFAAMKRVVSPSEPDAVHECRECGQTLAADTECCPICGCEDVVRIEFE